MQIIVAIILIILVLIVLSWAAPFLIAAFGFYIAYRLIRYIRKRRYFNSPEFLEHKKEITSTIEDYNEISNYIKDIPNNNQFMPTENQNEYSHLATFENTSSHDYKRNKHTRTNTDNVHHASLQVVRKASEEPIKYLCKYFNIKPTQINLNQLQDIGENISRMENTIDNLKSRQQKIETDFNPPKFILKHYRKELMKRLGINIPEINIEYSKYIFEYVSSGGNSSQRSVITFDGQTVEAISSYISERIKYKNSAKAQRALMTNSLRTRIKERDNYTCQTCSVSVEDQSLLLLEIDHIIPISKGGLSDPDNLQALCWKCNRTKSDKILSVNN